MATCHSVQLAVLGSHTHAVIRGPGQLYQMGFSYHICKLETGYQLHNRTILHHCKALVEINGPVSTMRHHVRSNHQKFYHNLFQVFAQLPKLYKPDFSLQHLPSSNIQEWFRLVPGMSVYGMQYLQCYPLSLVLDIIFFGQWGLCQLRR